VRVTVAVVLLFVLSARATARADDAPPVEIDVAPCVDVQPEVLQKLVQIELGTSIGGDADAATRAALTRVSITCVDAQTEIRLDDGITRKTMTRRVDLDPVDPSARTRLLALTTAELVVASWIELTLDPPALEPAGPPPPPVAREQARAKARIEADLGARDRDRDSDADRSIWELGIGVGGRLWTGEPEPLLGAEVEIVHRPDPAFGWLAAVGFERGFDRPEVPEGRIALSGFDLVAAGLVHTRLGRADLAAGLGAFVSMTVIEGLPNPDLSLQGHDARMFTAGPILLLRARLRLGERVGIMFETSGGPVTLPARATSSGMDVATLEGARLAATLGLGVSL